MARLLGLALCVSLLVLIAFTLVGRAIDTEVQDHIVFTRDGVTLDCARHFGPHGQVSYGDCSQVP